MTGPGDAPLVIQVITQLDVGGAQATALTLSELLPGEGFDVLLAAGPGRGTGGELWSRAAASGVATHRLRHLDRAIHPGRDAAALVELTRLFQRHRPAVVHTHSSKAGILGRLAARAAGVRVIVHTVHGWSFRDHHSSATQRAFVLAERLAGRVTDGIVTVSGADEQARIAHRIAPRARSATIPSGIDLGAVRAAAGHRDRARATLGLGSGVRVVGTVTRLGWPKDTATLLRALGPMMSVDPALTAVVVGDGPERAALNGLVETLGLAGRVQFLGVRDDVAALLPAFDVFVLSTQSEGTPRAVVEAMAAGVPVVSSGVGGLVELLENGHSGWLVESGSPEALTAALTAALGDPGEAARRAAAARQSVGRFDQGLMVSATAALYRALGAGG